MLFSPKLRFSDLRPHGEIENNQLVFHIDALISQNLVVRSKRGYVLTSKGKEYANRMNTKNAIINQQAKVSACIIPVREETDGTRSYLFYTRLKHPFYGCQGFMTGKVDFGEFITDGAAREFTEETGLIGNPELIHLRHYLVRDKNTHNLVEDKIFFTFRIVNPHGKLTPSEEGEYTWVHESKWKSHITRPFEDKFTIGEYISFTKKEKPIIQLTEVDHTTEKF